MAQKGSSSLSEKDISSFITNLESPSFRSEPSLAKRLASLRNQFKEFYGKDSEVHVRSPGRAEILGNHTDYNSGFALSCAISRSTVAFFAKRNDDKIRLRSNSFPNEEVTFDIHNLKKETKAAWSNYVRGVVKELLDAGTRISGADILVDSDVPGSGGVSSSASFEVACATGLSTLYGYNLSKLENSLLCKRAENGPLVGTPCGLLDQASVAFGENGKMVLLDFRATEDTPLGVRIIPANLALEGLSFVISVDPEVKRNLGETGYPARRKMCEESCPILGRLLNRDVSCLREVSVSEYERVKDELQNKGGEVMRMRVEHIVYENQRVLDGAHALEKNDYQTFASLLTSSGRSALELYGLDEKTPELTFLVETTRNWKGILGTRNMGGGFSAITLSLIKKADVPAFEKEVGKAYKKKWDRNLQFIDFDITQGVEIL